MHAGKAIQFFQDEKGISCIDLAKQAGITAQQLSRWRGSEDLKMSVMFSLCEVMDVNPIEFVTKASRL